VVDRDGKHRLLPLALVALLPVHVKSKGAVNVIGIIACVALAVMVVPLIVIKRVCVTGLAAFITILIKSGKIV
jgi:hypothetical protein